MNKIQDYALIGNCRSAALVSRHGAIEWLCWPHFDSQPIFASLLDDSRGQWSVTPLESHRTYRRYIDNTHVLQTTFLTLNAQVTLTDVMPVLSEEEKKNVLTPEHEILRKLECVQGQMEFKFQFFLSGRHFHCKNRTLGIRTKVNGGILILRSNIELNWSMAGLEQQFTIREGDVFYFSLSFSTEAPAVLSVLDQTTEDTVGRSIRWWEGFARGIHYQGPYRETVVRSALVLKLMSHAPSGAIIASPTTSLPEKIGGNLNWDYRYCWLRDASLTTHALVNIGLHEEAQAFVNWLLHATNLTRPKLKVLYDIYGRHPHPEKTLSQFKGYLDSRPVRIGNSAVRQEQLDIYGEVIGASVNILTDAQEIDRETQQMIKELGDYICQHWDEEDAGMWEVRGVKEHYTHSLLLCWAGLNGLMELHAKGLLQKLPNKIEDVHQRITQALDLAWNENLQAYAATLRGEGIDANALLLPWYKFIAADDIRMRQTYQCIKQELASSNGLLYRNRNQDEGVFILCSLWAVEFLALGGGALEEAEELFEYILSFANDVGLISEELDPATRDLLGNFPLAFSHSGVINAAVAIEKRRAKESIETHAGKARV
jgi:GH15 family glucan-1,4-alpha-glucosidase